MHAYGLDYFNLVWQAFLTQTLLALLPRAVRRGLARPMAQGPHRRCRSTYLQCGLTIGLVETL